MLCDDWPGPAFPVPFEGYSQKTDFIKGSVGMKQENTAPMDPRASLKMETKGSERDVHTNSKGLYCQ